MGRACEGVAAELLPAHRRPPHSLLRLIGLRQEVRNEGEAGGGANIRMRQEIGEGRNPREPGRSVGRQARPRAQQERRGPRGR